MSQIVEEIARYCREENTFGALLLCGEWGSGKTHVAEHDLPERLGDDGFVFLRISLFGADSVEGVRGRIRSEFLRAMLENLPASAEKSLANRWVPSLGDGSAAAKIYAADPVAYIRPEPRIGDNKLILIFDDLERSDLSLTEVLGLINEYCENLHIKTIVVANEEKMTARPGVGQTHGEESAREAAVYQEMKEKLISRTVRLRADTPRIVHSVVGQYLTPDSSYSDFLKEGEEALISLVEDCELKNIRSLRCGLQDFERVYPWLAAEALPEEEIRKTFTSVVLFTMLAKGGRISKSSLYGYRLNRLEEKYREHYDDRTMPDCLKDALLTGEWREEEIREQIRLRKELLSGNRRPEFLLRSLPLSELEEETVAEGWEAYLALFYEGRLTPEEMIRFLDNRLTARKYGYRWPSEPDEERLLAGAEIALGAIGASEDYPAPLTLHLEEQQLEDATSGERALAERITRYMDQKEYLFERDRNQVLAAAKSRDSGEWFRCRRCLLRCVDEELAEEIFACGRTLTDSRERQSFQDVLFRLLSSLSPGTRDQEEETARNLSSWEKDLEKLEKQLGDHSLERIRIRVLREQLSERIRKLRPRSTGPDSEITED